MPVCYFHLVFSVPHTLVPLIWQNKKLLFGLLFDASAATLLEVAAGPARLGAEIGFLSTLHAWGQTLQRHLHIHCVVPGGGLSLDHSRWIRSPPHFFLPVRVLSRVFRGKFVAGLRQAFHRKQIAFHGELQPMADEKAFAAFLRRFLQHVLPKGLPRIRYFGWLANRRRASSCHSAGRCSQRRLRLLRRTPLRQLSGNVRHAVAQCRLPND